MPIPRSEANGLHEKLFMLDNKSALLKLMSFILTLLYFCFNWLDETGFLPFCEYLDELQTNCSWNRVDEAPISWIVGLSTNNELDTKNGFDFWQYCGELSEKLLLSLTFIWTRTESLVGCKVRVICDVRIDDNPLTYVGLVGVNEEGTFLIGDVVASLDSVNDWYLSFADFVGVFMLNADDDSLQRSPDDVGINVEDFDWYLSVVDFVGEWIRASNEDWSQISRDDVGIFDGDDDIDWYKSVVDFAGVNIGEPNEGWLEINCDELGIFEDDIDLYESVVVDLFGVNNTESYEDWSVMNWDDFDIFKDDCDWYLSVEVDLFGVNNTESYEDWSEINCDDLGIFEDDCGWYSSVEVDLFGVSNTESNEDCWETNGNDFDIFEDDCGW